LSFFIVEGVVGLVFESITFCNSCV